MLLLGKHQFIVSSIDGPGIGDPRSPNKSSSSAMSNSLQGLGEGQGEYEYLNSNSNSKNKNRPPSSGRRNNASMVRFFLQFDFRFTF